MWTDLQEIAGDILPSERRQWQDLWLIVSTALEHPKTNLWKRLLDRNFPLLWNQCRRKALFRPFYFRTSRRIFMGPILSCSLDIFRYQLLQFIDHDNMNKVAKRNIGNPSLRKRKHISCSAFDNWIDTVI